MAPPDGSRLSEVLRHELYDLAAAGPWPLASVAVSGTAAGTWLSEARAQSSFHIGSVTKTFTALLLAVMVVKAQVSLEDPVARYLPAASGSGTRLVDLATHTAGFPRLPALVKRRMLLRLRDPYSLVRDRHVDRSLGKLSQEIGPGPHRFEYSNFGYGVLSRALSSAAGRPYGELLRQQVLDPLGLDEVTLETDPDPAKTRLFGFDVSGKEMEHWHNPALSGAGFLFSTVGGMRRYLEANLKPATTQLRDALRMVHEPRLPATKGMQVALGWLVRSTANGPLHWHNGGTAGFASFIGLDLDRSVGVAVLMARRHAADVDEAAWRILDGLRKSAS